MGTGYIHIYTGTGKGKTTAAVGLAVRALGHGLKVTYVHFMKQPDVYGYTEIDGLKKLGFTDGHPFCNKSLTTELLREQMHEAMIAFCNKSLTTELLREQMHEAMIALKDYLQASPPDLLILDEILITVRDGFLEEEALLRLIGQKPNDTELVMTGRGATEKLIACADYVSEIQKIKHPFDRGITSREGIEY